MHRLADALRGDAVPAVVLLLHGPAPVGLVDRPPHRVGHHVGVHDDPPVDVPGRPPDRLYERGLRAQKSLLVGVQDRHEADLRQIESLPEQVDAHDDVIDAQTKVPQHLAALQCIDLGVQVVRPHAGLPEEVGQLLGHALRKCRHQAALAPLGAQSNLVQQVVYLSRGGPYVDCRVYQACGADHLLDDLLAVLVLVRSRRRGDVYRLVDSPLELAEVERPVIHRGGQPKAVVDEHLFARPVAPVHPSNLRQRHVRLVYEQQIVVG